jgi:hypothetical protein
MIKKSLLSLGLVSLSVALAGNLSAATVVNPVGLNLTGSDAFFPARQIIDGSGLEFQLNTGDTLPATWNHRWGSVASDSWVSGAFGFPSDWFASSGTIPTFVLDLGQNTSLDMVHLWAYSGGAGVNDTIQANSAKTLEFRFNTDAQGNASFLGAATTVTLDHGPLSQTASGFVLPRQDFSVGSQMARWVEMRVTDNWFVAPGDGTTTDEHGHLIRGGDRVGLGEVRFSVVPEPSTWALGLGGLLALGAALRRRQ